MLKSPNPLFEEVESLSKKAEENWQKIKIPDSLKQKFANLWQEKIGYEATSTEGQIKLHTSATNSENVVDSDLAKAIVAGPYRKALHELRTAVKNLADEYNIETFKQDFGKTSNEQPPSWDRWQSAIIESSYTADEKALLADFLTNSAGFHGVKGISRDDFAAPAICNAIGKRIDRFGIADQIAMATSQSLADEIKALIQEKDQETESPSTEAVFTMTPLTGSLVQSLITKPFTILTGASGTGKTKLAESLAFSLRNAEEIKDATNVGIVPVGADWTDNRNVLGFVNHLRDVEVNGVKKAVYQSTPVLDLLLAANADRSTPHFLVLDEMNLSHVERYFAEFLSAMEQGNGILPLHSEGPRDDEQFTLPRFEGDTSGVPRSISYPANLYVIGTVNIDETTYMFSPKVLDRANVIEFKVGHGDISKFLDEPGNYPETVKAEDGQAAAFHQLGTQARNGELEDLPEGVHQEVQKHLLALFDIMQEGRFEFAYRTAKEVMRYMSVCRHLAADKDAWDQIDGDKGWKTDCDDQILQKILPKLHGSMGRVGGLLATLTLYCHTGEKDASGKKASVAMPEALKLEKDAAAFPKSFAKLKSMLETLKEEQFVSFIQ